MFGKNSYNKAVDNFKKIRNYLPGTPKYEKAILETIKYAKEAINKNKKFGDAHILLANAYLLASQIDFPSDNFLRYLPLAAAVIYEWKNRSMYSKEKANGEFIYQGVLDALNREIPDWMGVSVPTESIDELHSKFYKQALV